MLNLRDQYRTQNVMGQLSAIVKGMKLKEDVRDPREFLKAIETYSKELDKHEIVYITKRDFVALQALNGSSNETLTKFLTSQEQKASIEISLRKNNRGYFQRKPDRVKLGMKVAKIKTEDGFSSPDEDSMSLKSIKSKENSMDTTDDLYEVLSTAFLIVLRRSQEVQKNISRPVKRVIMARK